MSFLSQRLFSLCSPAATFSQIQPSLIDYGDDTNDPDFSQSYYESTPGVIIKQKSRRRENSQRMKGTTDDEIHFFLQNVNVPIASAMDGDIFLRESYDNITKCYKYEGINRSSYKSSLVKVMVDVCTAKSLIDYGKSLKLQTLLTVVGQLTEVLSNFNEHAGEMMMSNNSHCLVSVEKALIASVGHCSFYCV